jgi:hypothetical protein
MSSKYRRQREKLERLNMPWLYGQKEDEGDPAAPSRSTRGYAAPEAPAGLRPQGDDRYRMEWA